MAISTLSACLGQACLHFPALSFTFQNYPNVKRALSVEPVYHAKRLRRAKRAASHLEFASWALLCFSPPIIH